MAVPAAPGSSASATPSASSLSDDATVAPIVIDIPEALAESAEESPAEDGELWARAVEVAREAGDERRADALVCARALLAARQGDDAGALALWRGAFDRDPTLLVAFWGIRRALQRQGAWADLQGVLDRRIAAVPSVELAEERADLWLEHGRISEDRLGNDEDAVRSYRAGLIEVSDHPGLLTSLLLVGFRRDDRAMIAEALAGLLRCALPPALRASTTAFLARLERMTKPQGDSGRPLTGDAAPGPIAPEVAARVLETLRTALRAVGPEDLGPVRGELSSLARATRDPATRAEILNEMVSHGAGDLVPLLRERARLLRDDLGDPSRASEALRAALGHAPGHPLVISELADLVEGGAAAGVEDRAGDVAVTGLRDLLATVAPGDRPFESDSERELGIRFVTALARAGRAEEGLAVLDRHGELPRDRADLFALDILLRVAVGDIPGLAAVFESAGERMAAGVDGEPSAAVGAAHALVVAGTLKERSQSAGIVHAVDSDPAGSARGPQGDEATRLYRRAIAIAPDYVPALDALERRLGAAGRWGDLAETWAKRLTRLTEAKGDPVECSRLLEDLVAVHRDLLDDPATARRHQDEILEGRTVDARAWVRRHDLELALVARGQASGTETRVRILGKLADGAGSPRLAAALLVEAARVAAAGDDTGTAETLLRRALPGDTGGMATAGLERLTRNGDDVDRDANAAKRADLVREEISALIKQGNGAADLAEAGEAGEGGAASATGEAGAGAARLRALRFRVAWHALVGKRPADALEALAPLRAAADQAALAWSWEIARRSGDPRLEVAILQAVPDAGPAGLLAVPVDLAEALERSGDLAGAEAAYREVQRKEPSADAALGLLRVGSVQGNPAVVLEAVRALATRADPGTASMLSQEAALLTLLQSAAPGEQPPFAATSTLAGPGVLQETLQGSPIGTPQGLPGPGTPSPVTASGQGSSSTGMAEAGREAADDPLGVVLRWAAGARGADVLGAAAGLLGFARALPDGGVTEAAADRNGLLARAAARARLGGAALGGAVHDQVGALSGGAAPIGVGLADLPVAGRLERIAARIARAERTGGALAYALDLERAIDAEARGDAPGALDGFARALTRDAAGIEALDGIKRLALATRDRVGAARAGMRLAAVLRAPARAAAEFGVAGQIYEDLGMLSEAILAYWQALARDPPSTWLYERLRQLLGTRGDWVNLDRLYALRLLALGDPRARADLLLERAQHRLEKMESRRAAVDDFKRILKIDPDHMAALRHLATLAVQMEYFPQAVRFLERLLGLQRDEVQAAGLRLELAEAHEAARDPARAVEVLRQAVSKRPRDAAPWRRLTDLLLRTGDWPAALATLRSWDAVLGDPIAKAEIWIRIGALLRDHGRDDAAAVAAFATAADLDPLGNGIRELVALHERHGAIAARQGAIARAIVAVRRILDADPLDVPRLRRMRELHQLLASAGQGAGVGDATAAEDQARGASGALVVGQILTLAGQDVDLSPGRRGPLRGPFSLAFWSQLRPPGAGGFVAEIWPHLAEAAEELFPPQGRLPARERVPRGSEPRLAWIEAAAVAVGLATLELSMVKESGTAGKGIRVVDDIDVVPIEGSTPGLLLGRGVLAGDAAARFRVGRALGLLHDRSMVLERITDSGLALLLAASAVVAGAAPLADAGEGKKLDERVRALGKAISRKDRKALELEASRFGFESIDAADFRESVLASADRLGLVLAGDAAVAVRVAGAFGMAQVPPGMAAAIGADKRVLDLLRFALSEDYLTLRRDSGAEED